MSFTTSTSIVSYSPIMSDLESCQRVQKIVLEIRESRSHFITTKCIQISIPSK